MITFITTNKFKFEEVSCVLKDYGIGIEQAEMDYEEDKEASLDDIALKAAKTLADKLQKDVIVDDTGLYFNAYNDFPGVMPKYVFKGIGFEGIFRLLKDQVRGAYFRTVIAYCKPGGDPVLFDGVMYGELTEEVILPDVESMPYDHLFIPTGCDKVIAAMTLEEKNSLLQRGEAARKLGEFLKNSR